MNFQRNFEIGVIFLPSKWNSNFFSTQNGTNKENSPIFPLPYQFPLSRYGPKDKPWMWDVVQHEVDVWGKTWLTENSAKIPKDDWFLLKKNFFFSNFHLKLPKEIPVEINNPKNLSLNYPYYFPANFWSLFPPLKTLCFQSYQKNDKPLHSHQLPTRRPAGQLPSRRDSRQKLLFPSSRCESLRGWAHWLEVFLKLDIKKNFSKFFFLPP